MILFRKILKSDIKSMTQTVQYSKRKQSGKRQAKEVFVRCKFYNMRLFFFSKILNIQISLLLLFDFDSFTQTTFNCGMNPEKGALRKRNFSSYMLRTIVRSCELD